MKLSEIIEQCKDRITHNTYAVVKTKDESDDGQDVYALLIKAHGFDTIAVEIQHTHCLVVYPEQDNYELVGLEEDSAHDLLLVKYGIRPEWEFRHPSTRSQLDRYGWGRSDYKSREPEETV